MLADFLPDGFRGDSFVEDCFARGVCCRDVAAYVWEAVL